jgi:hypothetical protein
MFEFDGKALSELPVPPGAPYDSSYNTTLLVLPTGQLLFTDFSNDIEIYTPPSQGCAESLAWAPLLDPSSFDWDDPLKPGATYRISGWQLNGLSAGMAYGDDDQAATNYPLVRITNLASGHVAYARTHDHSTMSVAPWTYGSTSFDVPATAEPGPSELTIVANGIASLPIPALVARPRGGTR